MLEREYLGVFLGSRTSRTASISSTRISNYINIHIFLSFFFFLGGGSRECSLSFPQVFMHIYFTRSYINKSKQARVMSGLRGLVTTFVQVPLSKTLNLSCSTGASHWSTAEDCGSTELLPGVNVCNCTMNVKQGIAGKEQACSADFPKINKSLKKKEKKRKEKREKPKLCVLKVCHFQHSELRVKGYAYKTC